MAHPLPPVVPVLDPAGPVAARIAELWWLLFWLGTLVFAAVVVLLAAAVVRGRRASPGRPSGHPSGERAFVLAAGAAIPAVILIAVLVSTVGAGLAIAPPREEPDELVVEVVGHQFWWEVRYPEEGAVTANEIHIPVGRPVRLRLTAVDVIHSFWVPELGGKMDLVPGRTNVLRLQADRAGTYRGVCAEFCGIQHALMRLLVIAEPADEFAAWAEEQAAAAAEPQAGLAREGREVFAALGCAACHAVRGHFPAGATGSPGPDLTHLAARRTLAAGTLENTPVELMRWIEEAQEIKGGTGMPEFALDQRQRQALLAYLLELR